MRPPGNVVHLKTARKLARLVAKTPKKITWANPIATSSPEPLWCHQLEDGISIRDDVNVNPGTCNTYGLFQRKRIQHGFFRTFAFLVALMSASCSTDSPRVYHVKAETPKEVIESILGDMNSKQILALDQCADCRKRSLNCSTCKFRNSQSSLVDMKELKILSEHS